MNGVKQLQFIATLRKQDSNPGDIQAVRHTLTREPYATAWLDGASASECHLLTQTHAC